MSQLARPNVGDVQYWGMAVSIPCRVGNAKVRRLQVSTIGGDLNRRFDRGSEYLRNRGGTYDELDRPFVGMFLGWSGASAETGVVHSPPIESRG